MYGDALKTLFLKIDTKDRLRAVVLTSPPWGVLPDVGHDMALAEDKIKV